MEPGEVIDGRYKILEPLGEGGMGAVFIVEHVHMRKRMALKVLRTEMVQSEEMLARFEREAMAAAHIEHPNVVSATDFGHTAAGELFMVLEYIDGQSLRSALDAGPIPEPRALHIARQIASALSKAHELGIVHRDLKPENVMLVMRDGAEIVKVLDFGIAKLTADSIQGGPPSKKALTQVGAVFGTPEYMPPEQAQGQTVDVRADLYSLGVMLYEMIAGERPFVADDHVQLLMKHVLEPAPPLRNASNQTAALVAKLLEKSVDARPQTAKDVLIAIDAALGSETPAPVSVGYAKTQLPEKASPSLRMIQKVPTPFRRLPARLARLPKPALGAIGLAMLAIPILFVVLVVSWIRGDSSTAATTASGSVSAQRPPPKKEDLAPEDELSTAKTDGTRALLDLWSKYPKDARIGRAIVAVYASEKRWSDALSTIVRLAEADPWCGQDEDIRRTMTSAVVEGSTADVDQALGVMEGSLGAAGVDILLDLQGRQNLTPQTKNKIKESLAKPSVRAHASPAAAITLDLRAAKKCDDKKALLDRAKKDGDGRTLAVLTNMQQRSGCGFLGIKDCYSCMRSDSDLDDAVAALKNR